MKSVSEKACTKCGEVKPFTAFHRHSGCLHGYNTVCKACRVPLAREGWDRRPLSRRMYDRAKSRATRKGLEFTIELDDIQIPERCPVFGTVFTTGDTDTAASLDRIDSSKGYVRGNVQVLSNKANRIKSNATVEELQRLLNFLTGVCEI